jgi:hypothetical protein
MTILSLVPLVAMMAMFTSKNIFALNLFYRRFLDWAKQSKLNDKDKLDGFDEFLKPMLAAKL